MEESLPGGLLLGRPPSGQGLKGRGEWEEGKGRGLQAWLPTGLRTQPPEQAPGDLPPSQLSGPHAPQHGLGSRHCCSGCLSVHPAELSVPSALEP